MSPWADLAFIFLRFGFSWLGGPVDGWHVQDFPRFGAVGWTDVATAFQLIHDAGGHAIAKLHTALQDRHAGVLFGADDLQRRLDLGFLLEGFGAHLVGFHLGG